MARRSAASPGEIVVCELMVELLQDGPRFKKRLDPEQSEFTADAGMLESAERRLLVVQHAVDCHATSLDPRGDAAGALNVCAAYISVEAVFRVVGDPDRIFFVFVGDDREDGPENLFPGDCHVILHIDKYRWSDEETRLKAGRVSLASNEQFCALFDTLANVGLHALVLLLVHHGPDGGLGVGRIAGWKRERSIQDRLFDFLEATLRHKQPRTGDTSLTAVQKSDDEGVRNGLFEVGIIKQNVRRLAAQLKGDAFHRRGTLAHDRPPHSSRPREGN